MKTEEQTKKQVDLINFQIKELEKERTEIIKQFYHEQANKVNNRRIKNENNRKNNKRRI